MSQRRKRSAARAAVVPSPSTAPSSPRSSSPLPLFPSAPLPLCSAKARLATAALLAAGLALAGVWYGRIAFDLITLGPWGPAALFGFACIVALAVMLRPVVATITGVGQTIADHRRIATAIVTVASFAFLLATVRGEGRPLHPYVHDEFSYLIQAHQFARLHGWMPAHPLAPFFDSFQLLDAPVYASAYFPGTALLYVPGIWLGLPPWVTSLAVAAGVAGLLFRVAAELLDGPAAVAAVLLLWTDGRYRMLSIMTLAQMPLLLWGLAATLAWLKWRSSVDGAGPSSARADGLLVVRAEARLRRVRAEDGPARTDVPPKPQAHRWALALGATLGMAGLTRPVDALCFALPIGIDVLWSAFVRAEPTPGLRRTSDPASRPPLRHRLLPLALMLAPLLPFLLFQLALDRGITGHWTETPFRLYADRDYPGTSYGFHPFDPAARPISQLPQKQALYDEYRPVIADHTPASALDNLVYAHATSTTGLSPARIEMTLVRVPSLPLLLLLPLLPVALAGLTHRRAVVLAAVPLFLLLYVGYVFFFPHYTVTVAAAVVLAVVIGAQQLPCLLPTSLSMRASAGVPAFLIGLAIAGLPLFDAAPNDDVFSAPLIADVDRQLATLAHRPAVVLFTYYAGRNTNEEPVFNADVAWPDDAPIVRAHDLGPARNADLLAYYAARQPQRFAYRYDERTRTLEPLGPIRSETRPRTEK